MSIGRVMLRASCSGTSQSLNWAAERCLPSYRKDDEAAIAYGGPMVSIRDRRRSIPQVR